MLPRLTAFCQHIGGVDPELALAIYDTARLMLQIANHMADSMEPRSYQPTSKDTLSELVSYSKKLDPS